MKIKRISPRKTILGAFVVASIVSMSGCGLSDNIMRNLQGEPQGSFTTTAPQSTESSQSEAPMQDKISAKDVLEMSQKNFNELASYRMNVYSQTTEDFKISLAKSGKDNSVLHVSVATSNTKAVELYAESVYDKAQTIYLNAAGFWVKLEPNEISSQLERFPFISSDLNPINEYFKHLNKRSDSNLELKTDETVPGIGEVMGIHFKDDNNEPSVIYISKDTMLPVRIITKADTVASVSEVDVKGDVVIDIYDFNNVENIEIPEEAKNASGINNIANNLFNKFGSGAQGVKDKLNNFMGK